MTTVIAVTGIDPASEKPYTIFASDTQATVQGTAVQEEPGYFGPQRHAVRLPPAKQVFRKIHAPKDADILVGFAGVPPVQFDVSSDSKIRQSAVYQNLPEHPTSKYPSKQEYLEQHAYLRELGAFSQWLAGDGAAPQGIEKILDSELASGYSPHIAELNALQRAYMGPEGETHYLIAEDLGYSHAVYQVDGNGQ